MAKKKAPRQARGKAKKKAKKVKRKVPLKKKKAKKAKVKAKVKVKARVKAEKVIAAVDHFFGKISVAAFKLKAPLQVGDTIHVKGHTTDFTQRVDSMQIEHRSVAKAGKGAEIGIKVKAKVRAGDAVYLSAASKGIAAQLPPPIGTQKPSLPQALPRSRPAPPPAKKTEKSDPYGKTRFLKF